MKHIKKQKLIRGAGGGKAPKPQPAILQPPKLGAFETISSYSVAEIIDLISDGPIAGLVDQNGQLLKNNIFKGIYLDNTPIQNTDTRIDTASSAGEKIFGKQNIGWEFSNYTRNYLREDLPLTDYTFIDHKSNIVGRDSDFEYYASQGAAGSKTFQNVFWGAMQQNSKYYFFRREPWYEEPEYLQNAPITPIKITGPYISYPSLDDQDAIDNQVSYETYAQDFAPYSNEPTMKFTLEVHHSNPFDRRGSIRSKSIQTFKNRITTNQNKTAKEKEIANQANDKLNRVRDICLSSNVQFPSKASNAQKDTLGFIILRLSQYSFSKTPISLNENLFFYVKGLEDEFDYVHTIVIPEIANNQYTGRVQEALIILAVPLEEQMGKFTVSNPPYSNSYNILWMYWPKSLFKRIHRSLIYNRDRIEPNEQDGIFLVASNKPLVSTINSSSNFNFNNVSAEFKAGTEFQDNIAGFDKVYNDYMYETKLLGPFIKKANIQRIQFEAKTKDAFSSINNLRLTSDLTTNTEGSIDSRTVLENNTEVIKNFSDWSDKLEKVDYDSLTFTHTVENPLVDAVNLSIVVSNLSDTMHISTSGLTGLDGGKIEAGARVPTIVRLQIQTGKINSDNQIKDLESYQYAIVGLIEGPCVIDFGGDYAEADELLKKTVRIIEADNLRDTNLTKPFKLPELTSDENPTTTKRFVKVVKISTETNSVLINKDITLGKVTEIITQKLSYPFSSIVGIKMDARSFRSIPERSYDCKLKKVKIPSNYKILDSSTQFDIRYQKKASEYVPKKIYTEDWDGTFIEDWTDNPAWILYDLLTSKRYGLGAYIDESQVNKWELYKIARFCDAVDDEGYFIGVSDGVGGLEPRFSCNIIFKDQTKVYDAINVIASLFRGIVFFGGSEIHFLDDRPRKPIALFNNANVKDGVFNYSNTRKDLQFNTVEVVYLDRFDNYRTKVEYVQDEEDIRKRGVLKNTMNTMGVTSRAMARRIGQHIIYQTTKENQNVEFSTGLEALLCRPGDLIIVEDEMKTRSANYGKILAVDTTNKTIQVDTIFDPTTQTGFITAYAPTGYATSLELSGLAEINRSRVEQFTIDKALGGFYTLTGVYRFSGYTSGFANSTIYPAQFPLYTGQHVNGHSIFCYYSTGSTGFIFATGRPYQDNTVFDKIVTNTGVFFGADFSNLVGGETSNYTGYEWTSSTSDRRRRTTDGPREISGQIQWNNTLYPNTQGILDQEINTYDTPQITKISFTGYNTSGVYGTILELNKNDSNINFLSAVKPGSVYRIERKSASDQIYKVIAIREESQNQYAIGASRYDTGKFETIEKAITEDFLEQTYYTGPITVGNVQVQQLTRPTITKFNVTGQTANNFKLTGQWTSGANTTGFAVSISNSLAGFFTSENVNASGILLSNLTDIGNWEMSVTALARSPQIDSASSTTGTFVAYTGSLTNFNKPVINGFTLE